MVLRHNPVARNNDREGIGAASIANGAWAGVELLGKGAVTEGSAAGNLAQCMPDFLLEGCAGELQCKVELITGVLEIRFELEADLLHKKVSATVLQSGFRGRQVDFY